MVKNPPADAGDLGLILESGRSPGGANDNPLQYSCLENLMDRGAWWATVHGVARVGHSFMNEHSTALFLCFFLIFKKTSLSNILNNLLVCAHKYPPSPHTNTHMNVSLVH